jgi:hypothetical protein
LKKISAKLGAITPDAIFIERPNPACSRLNHSRRNSRGEQDRRADTRLIQHEGAVDAR